MVLPDSVVLSDYLPRNTFLDRASQEASTGVIKSKYKLLFKHHKEMEVFVFFVLTTKKTACVKERTFSIFLADWEYRKGTYLNADCSYIDVQKCVVMNKCDVIKNISGPSITFTLVGRLLQTKFSELFLVVGNYISSATTKTDFTIRDILRNTMEENKAGLFVNKFKI